MCFLTKDSGSSPSPLSYEGIFPNRRLQTPESSALHTAHVLSKMLNGESKTSDSLSRKESCRSLIKTGCSHAKYRKGKKVDSYEDALFILSTLASQELSRRRSDKTRLDKDVRRERVDADPFDLNPKLERKEFMKAYCRILEAHRSHFPEKHSHAVIKESMPARCWGWSQDQTFAFMTFGHTDDDPIERFKSEFHESVFPFCRDDDLVMIETICKGELFSCRVRSFVRSLFPHR